MRRVCSQRERARQSADYVFDNHEAYVDARKQARRADARDEHCTDDAPGSDVELGGHRAAAFDDLSSAARLLARAPARGPASSMRPASVGVGRLSGSRVLLGRLDPHRHHHRDGRGEDHRCAQLRQNHCGCLVNAEAMMRTPLRRQAATKEAARPVAVAMPIWRGAAPEMGLRYRFAPAKRAPAPRTGGTATAANASRHHHHHGRRRRHSASMAATASSGQTSTTHTQRAARCR